MVILAVAFELESLVDSFGNIFKRKLESDAKVVASALAGAASSCGTAEVATEPGDRGGRRDDRIPGRRYTGADRQKGL